MPLPATIFCPDFLRFEHIELQALLNGLRDPLTVHLFFLIATQADFKTGELLTNYDRLIELCTPSNPERGRRMTAPTLKQVRRALDWLQGSNLIKRDLARNEAQGMLRIRIRKRAKPEVSKVTPKSKEGRV